MAPLDPLLPLLLPSRCVAGESAAIIQLAPGRAVPGLDQQALLCLTLCRAGAPWRPETVRLLHGEAAADAGGTHVRRPHAGQSSELGMHVSRTAPSTKAPPECLGSTAPPPPPPLP